MMCSSMNLEECSTFLLELVSLLDFIDCSSYKHHHQDVGQDVWVYPQDSHDVIIEEEHR